MRPNRQTALSDEGPYPNARLALLPLSAPPPPDARGAMRVAAGDAIAFGRPKWEFAIGTCVDTAFLSLSPASPSPKSS